MKKQAQNGKNPTLQRLSSEFFHCYPCAFIIRILSTSWQSVLPSSAFWFPYHNDGVQAGKGNCSCFCRQPWWDSSWNSVPCSSAHTLKRTLKSMGRSSEGLERESMQRWIDSSDHLRQLFPHEEQKKPNLRSVPPGKHEFRFDSCPGDFKLPSPVSSVSAPDATLKDMAGSDLLSCSSCSWV